MLALRWRSTVNAHRTDTTQVCVCFGRRWAVIALLNTHASAQHWQVSASSRQPQRASVDNQYCRQSHGVDEATPSQYKQPVVQASKWSETLDYDFASARVGEYPESTARANSWRGLYYRVSHSRPP